MTDPGRKPRRSGITSIRAVRIGALLTVGSASVAAMLTAPAHADLDFTVDVVDPLTGIDPTVNAVAAQSGGADLGMH
jgi:hypothetical protein